MRQEAQVVDSLLDRCRAGDAAAWRQFYDLHFPMVFRLAIRLGAREREAADVAQEVFVRVWRGLASFRGESNIRTWIYRIALNETARAGREAAVRKAFAGVLALVGKSQPPEARSAHHLVEQAEAFAELQEILAQMKPKQRTVLVLFEIEELPLEEIAQMLDCPLETVRSRMRHARADFDRLRRQRASTQPRAQGGTP